MKCFIHLSLLILISSCQSKSSEDYHKEANQLEDQGKFKEAIKVLDERLEDDPNNIYMLLDTTVDKSYSEDYLGAIKDYTKIINLDPDNTLAFVNRGKNHARLDQYKLALADFNSAISTKGGETIFVEWVSNDYTDNYDFDVSMIEIKFERGIALYKLDSLEKAYSDFHICVQIHTL